MNHSAKSAATRGRFEARLGAARARLAREELVREGLVRLARKKGSK